MGLYTHAHTQYFYRKEKIEERGITLVALIITIVIIIILAIVTLNFAFGENGIVKQAQSAADYYANDTKYTEESLSNVTAYLNSVLNGSNIGDGDLPEQTATTVAEARENGIQYLDTTPIKDDLENTVYIPGGFHIAKDSGTKVEEGIVIEDEDGNQFVWIPTGEYKATDITSTENPKTSDNKNE